MTTGDVELTIIDGGGAVQVPSQAVQVVMGCSSAGSAASAAAIRNPNTLITQFGYGPLVEAAAMVIRAGGTAICLKTAETTAGTAGAVDDHDAAGTSVITVTGTPYDTYFVKVVVTTGGTRGTTGIKYKISLDAGRTYGPILSLGTSTTYTIPNTGITLNFAAGTLIADEYYTFMTTEPLWGTAGVLACFNAMQASPYALTGWGSLHILGEMSGANATTIKGYLNTWKTGKIFSRSLMHVRDASPTADDWGGTGETESTWIGSVQTSFASTVSERICVSAGHYNMSSEIPTQVAGLPKYRRPLSYALAAKQVTIQPQKHAGRVKDGPIAHIVTDPINDPSDGFIYHDERLNPGFDESKFCAAWTRARKKGWWFKNPNLMSTAGSIFTILPLGQVMDIGCGIAVDKGADDINEDIRLNRDGTIYENDAVAIELSMGGALRDNMLAKNMISDYRVVVDRTNNVQSTSEVNVAITIWSRGYILQENITIGFGTAATV
jgi:hypothetical protein